MSLDSQRSFGNSIVGLPQVGADVNVYDIHATARLKVGTRFVRSDGNTFVYGYSGVGTAKGVFVAPTYASSGLVVSANNVIAVASAVAVAGDAVAPGDAGSRYIEITLAAVTANQYAGGYIAINGGSGAGFVYRIKGNTATGNPASGNIRIELREPLVVRLTINTDIAITPSPWNDVVIADTSTNTIVSGVSMNTTTTTKPYGWFQTTGTACILQQGAIAIGSGIQLSASVNGAATLWGTGGSTAPLLQGMQCLGRCVTTGSDTTYGLFQIALGL